MNYVTGAKWLWFSTSMLAAGLCLGGCVSFTTARADPDLLSMPVYEPLAAGSSVEITWHSVNGARPPGDTLECAVVHYQSAVSGEVVLIEGDAIELDLGEDGGVSQEQFDAIVDESGRKGSFEMVMVVAPAYDFHDAQAIYSYNYVGKPMEPLRPHVIRVSVQEMNDVGAARLFVTEDEIWEYVLTHELFHSLGLPSNRSHRWDGGHCTRVGCLMYPGVVDLRSRLRLLFRRSTPLALCNECDAELSIARNSAVVRQWNENTDFGRLWLDRNIAINPGQPQAIGKRYRYAMAREDYALAMEDANKIIEVSPDWHWHYVLRARVFTALAERARAVPDYEAALRLEPESSLALNELALLLATSPEDELRDGARAVELATRACELGDWEDHEALNALACSMAELGDFESAVTHQSRAVELVEDSEADAYRNRLEMFRAGKPDRMSSGPPADSIQGDPAR